LPLWGGAIRLCGLGLRMEALRSLKKWEMFMAAGDREEVVALNFWLDGEWEVDMVEGQCWQRSVRSMEVEWRCAKLFEW